MAVISDCACPAPTPALSFPTASQFCPPRCPGGPTIDTHVGVPVRESEARRQYADDRPRPCGANGLPQDARVAAETGLPVGIADHRRAGSASLHFLRCEAPARDRLDPEDAKELGAHLRDPRILSRIAPYHRKLPRVVIGHRLERRALPLPILEIRNRHLLPKRGRALLQDRVIAERHNPVGVAIRQRLQQHGIHDAEHGRVGADPERHDENGKRRETGTPSQAPPRIPEIPQQVADVIHASHIAAFLLVQCNSIQRAKRDAARLLGRGPAADLQLHALFDVKLELLIQLAFDAIPPEYGSQPEHGL
jgi:hypothetical protein